MISLFWYYGFQIFFYFFYQNCIFYEFFLFPCQNVTLLTSPIKGKRYSENAQRWKEAYLDMLIVFVELFMRFGLRHSYLAKFFGFLISPNFVFLFVNVRHISDSDIY